MVSYGAASFVEYPTLSHQSINFLIVKDTGLNFYRLVKLISCCTAVIGGLTVLVAMVIIVSSCFESVTAFLVVGFLQLSFKLNTLTHTV